MLVFQLIEWTVTRYLFNLLEDTTQMPAIVSNAKDLDGECSPRLFGAFTAAYLLAWVVVVD